MSTFNAIANGMDTFFNVINGVRPQRERSKCYHARNAPSLTSDNLAIELRDRHHTGV